MINAGGDVLYVGKAKSLKKRVASYTRLARQPVRTLRMVAETVTMEFVITDTEAEALLLEANLIKRFQPRYNILLRDDKSFPSILLTGDHAFAQVLKHRGARSRKGDYFGPFASVWAVNQTLVILQQAFLLRSCSDAVFSARTRPCLLHQIKRCSAPCVGRIDGAEYAALIEESRSFLAGDSQSIQRRLAHQMQEASDALEFERAAHFRDRIRALARVQARHDTNARGIDEADIIAAHGEGGQTCVQVFFLRAGQNYGNRAYFPSHAREDDAPLVLAAFIGQFYVNKPPPREVLVSHPLDNTELIAEALSVRAGRRVRVAHPRRGVKRKLVEHSRVNARDALSRRMVESASQRRNLEGLVGVLRLEVVPERIEVYDNSHISGTQAVGAMIVAGPDGFMKKAYRKFTIRSGTPDSASGSGFQPGDDYAMMRQLLTRRFSRALRGDSERASGQWPDLVLVDGGAGQLAVAVDVFEKLGIDDVAVAAIAKGRDRNSGRERIFLPGSQPFTLSPRDRNLYFLQRLRDEAHRFAIGAHRSKRAKSLTRSSLDDIPGIGAKRKKALLHHFGSAAAVSQAGQTDLKTADGISGAMAKKIYEWFLLDR